MFSGVINIKGELPKLPGIIGLQTASYYYGWGTNIPKGISLLSDAVKEPFRSGLLRFVPTKDMTNNITKLPSNNYITNPERTILELMNYMPIDEFTSQDMEDYGIEEKLEELKKFNDTFRYCTQENFDLAVQCYYEYVSKVF